MSGGAWMSDVFGNYEIGFKLGLRRKQFGKDWDPAAHAPPPVGPIVVQSINRYTRGEPLAREEFPEAAAVWDEKSFRRAKDLFSVGGFYCVKGKLAETLAQFDLGEGGLIPFPVYQADLATPYAGEFFLLNFGCIKNSILVDQCEDATKFLVRKATGVQVYHLNDFKPEGEVVLSPRALEGPDLWFEEAVHEKLFLSDALGQALLDIGMGEVFRLTRCRIA
ncbi:hypothetical protein [Erythrobacter colymbi]|uniref:hypothetical protein n=1 Tax=Erythrobacter colymbi TaxID=1161202 RepID=UPI00118129A4|nr:hypothetical protein [Erythrobacter colymbi]